MKPGSEIPRALKPGLRVYQVIERQEEDEPIVYSFTSKGERNCALAGLRARHPERVDEFEIVDEFLWANGDHFLQAVDADEFANWRSDLDWYGRDQKVHAADKKLVRQLSKAKTRDAMLARFEQLHSAVQLDLAERFPEFYAWLDPENDAQNS